MLVNLNVIRWDCLSSSINLFRKHLFVMQTSKGEILNIFYSKTFVRNSKNPILTSFISTTPNMRFYERRCLHVKEICHLSILRFHLPLLLIFIHFENEQVFQKEDKWRTFFRTKALRIMALIRNVKFIIAMFIISLNF